jgi:competence ComEA-like helix-hairpin-helix protein
MKQFLRDYFTFNRRERNGVFVLLSIIILLLIYLSFSDYFYNIFSGKNEFDFSKFEKEIIAFEAEQKKCSDSVTELTSDFFYRNKEPEFENKEDVNYNFNKSSENYPKQTNLYEKQKRIYTYHITSNNKHQTTTIELNSADTTQLIQLKGIGSVLASRIVKYRDKLGGFVSKEQLMEVQGIDKEKFDLISSQITLDSSAVKKININTASVETLLNHPYIDKKTAMKIFMHRVNQGDYSDLQEIKKLNFADEQLFSKIAPYLTIK